MATHAVFSKEELQRANLPEDIIKFYSSNPNALKELILERDYYKKMFELQQQRINDFTKQFTKLMDQKINYTNTNTNKTLRSCVYEKYYENLYATLDWSSFAKY